MALIGLVIPALLPKIAGTFPNLNMEIAILTLNLLLVPLDGDNFKISGRKLELAANILVVFDLREKSDWMQREADQVLLSSSILAEIKNLLNDGEKI
jgi:hypothetical protein